MSREAAITAEMGWHRYEHKFLDIAILDDADAPVDMDTTDLRWLLLTETGGVTILEKLKSLGEITIVNDANDNIARIEIETPDDYDDLEAGWYYHELWDITNNLLLCYGDAFLGEGAEPAA
jgi:hypothetical protein